MLNRWFGCKRAETEQRARGKAMRLSSGQALPRLPSAPGIRPVIAFVCSQEVLFGWHLFGNEETAAHLGGETNVFTS